MEVLQASENLRIDHSIIIFALTELIEPCVCEAFQSCRALLGLDIKHLFKQAFQFIAEAWHVLIGA